MAWDDFLLPASFRGIPFFVQSHEKNGGRNAVSHEPPDRDSSFAEDMGKKSDGYRITGHILGDTYFFIRDALITAMETRETGSLIHPYLGYIDVQPKGYTFTEDTSEGRICRFEMEFVEAGDPSIVGEIFDLVTGFVSSVVSGVAQVKNDFETAVALGGLPGFAIESTVQIIQDFLDTGLESLDKFATDQVLLPDLLQDMADLQLNKRSLLLGDPVQLVDDIDNIAKQMKDVVLDEDEDTDTIDTGKDKSPKIEIYTFLLNITLDFDVPTVNLPTLTRVRETENNNATTAMIRRILIIRLCEAAADNSYRSVASGVSQRDEINDLLDEQMGVEGIDDNLFQALRDQKAANVTLIPDPRQISGTVTTLDVISTTPSIVLAYDFYGNVDTEQDIIDRNRIMNPAFVDGEVEVVSFG